MLAEQGVVFFHAFANTSTTLPSHANILLGVSLHFYGVHENQHFVVRPNFLTLTEHLKAAGYATGAFVGAFPLDKKFGLDQGFDVYDDEYGHRTSEGGSSREPSRYLSDRLRRFGTRATGILARAIVAPGYERAPVPETHPLFRIALPLLQQGMGSHTGNHQGRSKGNRIADP